MTFQIPHVVPFVHDSEQRPYYLRMVGGVSRENAIEDLFRFVRRGGADVAAVEGEQRSIAFVASFQFGGRPVHGNAAVFEEQHAVGARNALEMVGDEQDGAAFERREHRFEERLLGCRVEAREGFVEYYDRQAWREECERARCDGVHRQRALARFVDDSVKPVRQLLCSRAEPDAFECVPEFVIGRVSFADEQVFSQELVEDMGIPLDDADKERCRGFLAGGIRFAYEDTAAIGRSFAAKQRCEGGFASAASSQNGNNATVRYRKAQVSQNRTIRARVGESHVPKRMS